MKKGPTHPDAFHKELGKSDAYFLLESLTKECLIDLVFDLSDLVWPDEEYQRNKLYEILYEFSRHRVKIRKDPDPRRKVINKRNQRSRLITFKKTEEAINKLPAERL